MADLQHSIQLAVPPAKAWPLIATAAGFGGWWATDITEADGATDLGFFNRATVYRLRLRRSDAPAEADWVCETGDQWAGTRLVFRLEASKSGTLLRFTHAGWKAETDYFVSCNTTWGELMFRLKATAEGHGPGPLFSSAGMAY